MSRTISTYVEVDIADFDDQDLIDELRARGIFVADTSDDAVDVDPKKAAINLLQDLVRSRSSDFSLSLIQLIDSFGPLSHAAEAIAALVRNDRAAAINHLDRLIAPVVASADKPKKTAMRFTQ